MWCEQTAASPPHCFYNKYETSGSLDGFMIFLSLTFQRFPDEGSALEADWAFCTWAIHTWKQAVGSGDNRGSKPCDGRRSAVTKVGHAPNKNTYRPRTKPSEIKENRPVCFMQRPIWECGYACDQVYFYSTDNVTWRATGTLLHPNPYNRTYRSAPTCLSTTVPWTPPFSLCCQILWANLSTMSSCYAWGLFTPRPLTLYLIPIPGA